MFDLPDAKRIRRSDLFTHSPARSLSQSRTPSPDPTLQQTLHSRLAALYGPITTSAPISNSNGSSAPKPTSTRIQDDDPEPEEEQEQEQGYEFRLFSTPHLPPSHFEPQKIILQEDNEDLTGSGGFITRERDKSYYFAEKAEGERKASFEVATLSGDQVLLMKERRNWGLEVPWRVRIITTSSLPAKRSNDEVLVDVNTLREPESRKTKPGKKRRILLREKRRKRESIVARMRAEQERREEAEREKKTRRNREKKVKRKMKEKAKKSSTLGVEEGSGSE